MALGSTQPLTKMSTRNLPGGNGRRHILLACWFLAELSTLKMEAICSSETSVDTQRTTRSHFAEDDTLHNHLCVNLKSYIVTLFVHSCFTFLVT
jgi:hypothetical protein